MYKKIVSVIALFLCFATVITPAFANTDKDVYLSLQIDNPIMNVNGEAVEVDEGRGTVPLIVDGRTMLPIRAVIEAFGGEVSWDEETSSVIMKVGDNSATLTIGSLSAQYNGREYVLDVAPQIINGRTMLPIRFIAECFGFGIAWDNESRRVYIIRDVFTETEYDRLLAIVPDYSGEACATINDNNPFFKEYEIIGVPFEYYGALDEFGRCSVTVATLDDVLMPEAERGSISSVTPTGWINEKFDFIPGGYLYNRCHLIGYQLTGENANERNLITGTRYLNIEGMLEYENTVAEFVRKSDSFVTYRVTPVFSGNNSLAHGVLIEALSQGSDEEKLSLCIFCYNVQPGIVLEYLTGESRLAIEGEDIYPFEYFGEAADKDSEEAVLRIYRTPSGSKYHTDKECGGKNSYEITLEEALAAGLTPCGKCAA